MSKSISKRKEYEIRTKKKRIIKAINKAIEALIDKGDKGETYRDEDLRFLRNVFKDLKALEESIADDKKGEELPEGNLKRFVEMEWKLKDISKDREKVVELTGYYRCTQCGDLHIKGRSCMYEEYQTLQGKQQLEEEEISEDEADAQTAMEAEEDEAKMKYEEEEEEEEDWDEDDFDEDE